MAEAIDVHKVFSEYFPGIEAWAYAVSEALDQGSICLDINVYKKELEEKKKENPYSLEGHINTTDLKRSVFVTEDPDNDLRPFVVENGKLYMQRYFAYQTKIVEKIKALIAAEADLVEERRAWLSNHSDEPETIDKTDWQKVAVQRACMHNFSIITGGPGTGKTTTVARILAILFQWEPDLKVALAAPTGKAAARMGESLNQAKDYIPGLQEDIKKRFGSIVPRTIHRLLESIPNSTLFRHNAENPLQYDLVIIDEASMVDSALMYKLLEAVQPRNRTIFLGDKNQLASVEAGSIFGDLCRAVGNGNILFQHITQLHRNYRSESSEINTLCKLIIENKWNELKELIQSVDRNIIDLDIESIDSKLNEQALAYTDYINEPDIRRALRKINKFRALCAIREGKHGVYQVNKRIEKMLKTKIHNPALFYPLDTFYHNQVIMVTSNNYELGVFNGDTGIIRRKNETDDTLIAYFESSDPEQPKEILPGYLNEYESVYAMTIHKSQGSEFDTVAVILPENEDSAVLTRELLYTAVSRAKKKVLIQSPLNVLMATISREVTRASGIIDQFHKP